MRVLGIHRSLFMLERGRHLSRHAPFLARPSRELSTWSPWGCHAPALTWRLEPSAVFPPPGLTIIATAPAAVRPRSGRLHVPANHLSCKCRPAPHPIRVPHRSALAVLHPPTSSVSSSTPPLLHPARPPGRASLGRGGARLVLSAHSPYRLPTLRALRRTPPPRWGKCPAVVVGPGWRRCWLCGEVRCGCCVCGCCGGSGGVVGGGGGLWGGFVLSSVWWLSGSSGAAVAVPVVLVVGAAWGLRGPSPLLPPSLTSSPAVRRS